MTINVIILAAGASRRMREPKQLLTFNGVSLIRHAAQTALALDCGPVVAVIGANADLMRGELSGLDIAVVKNEEWEDGLSTSIRCGLQQVPVDEDFLIMLADQPLIAADEMSLLVDRFKDHGARSAVVAGYDGIRGVPAVFPASARRELMKLSGDQGARKVIERRSEVIVVAMPPAAFDIDTPDDYESLCKSGSARFS